MSTAFINVKKHLYPRQDAFVRGLRSQGFSIVERDPRPGEARAGDAFVIWNRRRDQEPAADALEAAGGSVLVAENGYIGKDADGSMLLALARHGHNGSGSPLIEADPSRWARLGIPIAPWRETGEHILVCPNRFIAPRWFMMPEDWVDRTVAILKRHTDRPIRVRPHPGHWKRLPEHPAIALRRELTGAWATVVWSSTAAVHSLLAGVPAIVTAPWAIIRGAAETDLSRIEAPAMGDRLAAFELLARSQFSLSEIASGLPFRSLRVPAMEAA